MKRILRREGHNLKSFLFQAKEKKFVKWQNLRFLCPDESNKGEDAKEDQGKFFHCVIFESWYIKGSFPSSSSYFEAKAANHWLMMKKAERWKALLTTLAPQY